MGDMSVLYRIASLTIADSTGYVESIGDVVEGEIQGGFNDKKLLSETIKKYGSKGLVKAVNRMKKDLNAAIKEVDQNK